MKALQAREWLGNIRELENVVERAVISTRGEMFDLGEDVGATPRTLSSRIPEPDRDDPRTLEQVERDHIVATLERLQWRVTGAGGAAAVLAINPSTLCSRMRKLGIQRPPTSGVATSRAHRNS